MGERKKNQRTTLEQLDEALLRLDDKWVQTMICSSSTQPSTDQRAAAARGLLHAMKCKFFALNVAFMM